LSTIEEFIQANPTLLSRLSAPAREAYLEICASMAHLRSRRAREFFLLTVQQLEAVEALPHCAAAMQSAVQLSRMNWSLVAPCLTVIASLPDGASIARWTAMVLEIAGKDIDGALAFLEQTPKALAVLGTEGLWLWGRQALTALASGNSVWKAVKAYLEAAVTGSCAIPLSRWRFFLEQADRIAAASANAAAAFIQHGNRACLLLNDQETVQWVDEGLAECRTQEELHNFFSGTSLNALAKRDGLVSGIALKDRGNTLAIICEALMGRPVRIRSNTSILGQKGFTGSAATDGRTIFLPDMAPSFDLMKLMTLHQAMLLGQRKFLEGSGKIFFDPVALHLDADRRLLARLPSLANAMRRCCPHVPDAYPDKLDHRLSGALPWWGDILADLVQATDATIDRIKEKAADYADIPPEMVESLMAALMADGARDGDALWEMFREMLDNMVMASPDPEELHESIKTFLYKEWDQNLSDYKMDWCMVRQRLMKDDPNGFADEVRTRLHGIIGLTRRQFMRLKPQRFRKFRAQPIGDALDLDALVSAVVDMRSGASLSENIYIRRDKRVRDVAVLFLVDLSASTEEKINGRRILDIQKEAMVLMAEALDSLGDPYAILGFSSEGRFRVDLFNIKDFNEAYGNPVRNRIGHLEPLGLTRMGAVIRHAAYRLEGVAAAVKLLVILTDGRPYDLEYGNLDYAVADTKKAIGEARRKRIHPFIITSDQKSTEYLKRIAPQSMSIILPKVEMLPRLLPAVYKRLTM
jgi:hypothetical protein